MNKSFIRYVVCSVVGIESFFMLLTSLIALIYHESVFWAYFIPAVIFGSIGLFGYLKKPKKNVFYAREGFVSVALSWIAMSLIGCLPLYFSKEIPVFIDALFETVSGFTTTGSTIINDVEILSHACLFWRSFTHWIGGMGILVFVLAILPMAGGYGIHIMRAESPGPSVGKLVPRLKQTARILYTIYFLITFAQVICLLLCKMPLFDSIVLSMATAGTGGFGILNDSFCSYSSAVQVVTAIFMLLFGINFNVYYYLSIRRAKDAYECEEMHWYLGIIFVATALIAVNTLPYFTNGLDALKHAFFQVCTVITTTGYASFDFNTWPMLSKIIMVVLMFCGACAGSTGGGFKVSRAVILLKDAHNSILSYIRPHSVKKIRFEHKAVDRELLDGIRSYLAIYVFVLLGSLILIGLDKMSFTASFTGVVSAMNNIGPGLEEIGPMFNYSIFSPFSKIVLMFDMLTGRLELIPMLILFSPFTYRKAKKANA